VKYFFHDIVVTRANYCLDALFPPSFF